MSQCKLFPSFLLLCPVDSYSPCRDQLRGTLHGELYADPTLKVESTDHPWDLTVHALEAEDGVHPSLGPVHLTNTVSAYQKLAKWLLEPIALILETEREQNCLGLRLIHFFNKCLCLNTNADSMY